MAMARTSAARMAPSIIEAALIVETMGVPRIISAQEELIGIMNRTCYLREAHIFISCLAEAEISAAHSSIRCDE